MATRLSAMRFDVSDPTGKPFRQAIGERLAEFVAEAGKELAGISPESAELAEVAEAYCAGGKRLRPAFVYWGYAAFAGQDDAEKILDAGAGFEMLHAGILVHDDLIDQAETRRGKPVAHRVFNASSPGRPAYGRSAAVVVGDLMIAWANSLVYRCQIPRLNRALPYWWVVQQEVNAGQHLDIANQYGILSHYPPLAAAELVLETKTARYTVMRPLQFGAAAAGATPAQLQALADFASPIGRAFQLRDDLLGVFGDESVTGKTMGADLMEGKRTVLAAYAFDRLPEAQADALRNLFGRTLTGREISKAQELIEESGARRLVENRIDAYAEHARQALAKLDLTEDCRRPLAILASQCVNRQF